MHGGVSHVDSRPEGTFSIATTANRFLSATAGFAEGRAGALVNLSGITRTTGRAEYGERLLYQWTWTSLCDSLHGGEGWITALRCCKPSPGRQHPSPASIGSWVVYGLGGPEQEHSGYSR
jgi:hypothetical protein